MICGHGEAEITIQVIRDAKNIYSRSGKELFYDPLTERPSSNDNVPDRDSS
jgi:hypothetical protein